MLSPADAALLQLAAVVGMVVGLIGALAPIVPGTGLIWLSAVAWAWADGFERVGWGTLLAMGALAVLAEGADLLLTSWSARRQGAGWRSMAIAALGALVGFAALSLPGAVVGALGGLAVGEAQRLDGDWAAASRTVRAVLAAYLLAAALELVLALGMLGMFWTAAR